MLSPTNLTRLALIKYLFVRTVDLSKQPEPACALAILGFHDAVELALLLACEHQQVSVGKKPDFIDYWGLLATKVQVTQRQAMARLNTARVSFKHKGSLPSKLEIQSCREFVTAFFAENCATLFGVSFDSISLADLIACASARQYVHDAEREMKTGDGSGAAKNLALAFTALLDDYEKRKTKEWRGSPFFFGQEMTFLTKFHLSDDIDVDGRLGDFVDATSKSIGALQDAVRILSLGLDYRKYARFRALTPRVRHGKSELGGPLTPEDFYFCLTYVVEAAVDLQSVDYDLK